jgi:hypothetical protein
MSADDLAKYIGSYQVVDGDVRVLTIEEDKLLSQGHGGSRSEIVFYGDGHFSFGAGSMTTGAFELSEDGSVEAMVITPWGGKGQRANKLEEAITSQ